MLKREITIRLSSSHANARRELPAKKRQSLKGSALTIALLAILGLLGSVRAGAAASAPGNDPGPVHLEQAVRRVTVQTAAATPSSERV